MSGLPYWRLSGFYFFYFAFVGAFSPYWTLYLKSLAFTALEIGTLMSLLQVMRIFGPNLWGAVADRTGRHMAVIRLSAFLGLAAYCAVFFGTGFAWLFVAMAAMSFFWSASLPLVEAATLDHLGDRPDRYGLLRSWGSVGFIVAVLGVGYLLDAVPIAALLWIVLVLKLGILGMAMLIPAPPAAHHAADSEAVWAILRRPQVLALFGACFLMAAAHGPYYVFFSIYLVDHGYSTSAVGWLWALGVICEIGVFFAMPRLAGRFSLAGILAFSFAVAVLRFLVVAWAVDSLPAMLFAQALHAFTFGSYHAAAVALIHEFFKGRHQAKGQALYTSVSFGAGGTLGGFIAGWTWEGLGADWTFTLSAAAALAGLVLVAARLRAVPPAAAARA